ncbi:MAG: NADH-quinone oxidoreductase subunit N [Chloroflexi bacterium]|nr:NADH-quinone oxidoreductase subunit N [Chloroflexota bacterium]MBU1749241.1 NADH-quinone oxidoreductase subunit N [Chloroflexota bacterium]
MDIDVQSILVLLGPELVLSFFALVIMLLGLVSRQRISEGLLRALALIGPILAGLWTLWLLLPWNGEQGAQASLLGGMATVDPFALFFALLACLATILVVLMSWEYVTAKIKAPGEFYSLLLFAATAICLVAAASDLIMIYVAIEFLSLSSYMLTGFLRNDDKSTEAGLKYFLYGAVASAVMLYGMSLFYGMSGSTSLSIIGQHVGAGRFEAVVPLILLLAGFGFKIAAVPFHQWSPDAYEGAPTPITAFLSVAPKAAGFAVLTRVLTVALPDLMLNWVALLSGICVATMFVGNLSAIPQKNIKRMLAYSSIAQAGYVLIGVITYNAQADGYVPILIFLLGYLFTNLGLFAAVIGFSNATGSDEIKDYAGLVKRAPWLAVPMLIFFLSLAGFPATAGFIGKFYIFKSAVQTMHGPFLLLALLGVLNSVISVGYYFNVVRYMFFTPLANPEDQAATIKPIVIGAPIMVALIIALVGTLIIGLYPGPFIDLVQNSAVALLPM